MLTGHAVGVKDSGFTAEPRQKALDPAEHRKQDLQVRLTFPPTPVPKIRARSVKIHLRSMEYPIAISRSGRWATVVKWYLWTSGAILMLAGVSKVIGLQRPAAFLSNPNSVFSFISNQVIMVGVSFVEISVAILLLSSIFDLLSRLKMLFWIASLFAIYRSILFISKEPEPCRCFGQIFDWFHLEDSVVRLITNGAFLFLLVPSSLLVITDYFGFFKSQPTSALLGE